MIREEEGTKAEIREGFVIFGEHGIDISVVSRTQGTQSSFALRVIRSSGSTPSEVELPILEGHFGRLYGFCVRQREIVLSRESFALSGGTVHVDQFQRAGSRKAAKSPGAYLPGPVMHANFTEEDQWLSFCAGLPRHIVHEVAETKHYVPGFLAIHGLPEE